MQGCYASRTRRIAAMVYELLLLIGVVGVGAILPWVVVGMLLHWVVPGWVLWLHVVLLLGFYFVGHWRRGATLAMKTWKLRLVDFEGRTPSLRACMARFLWAWPAIVTGAGWLWSFWDRDGLWLQDRLSRTVVVFWDWGVE